MANGSQFLIKLSLMY